MTDTILSSATVVLALFTAWMAFETRRLAKEGRESADQADRHHQESLAPILHFDPHPINNYSGGIQFEWGRIPDGCRFRIGGILHNSGLGPALNVKVTVIIPSFSVPLTITASPVGPREKNEYFREEVRTEINETQCNMLRSNQQTWEMEIEYKDLFENPYKTRMSNIPHQANKLVGYSLPKICSRKQPYRN